MRKVFTILLAVMLVLGLSTAALAQEIIVAGTGTVSLPADTATLELGASFKAQTAQEAQQLTDAAIRQILEALDGLGIEKKDIITSNYSVYVEVPYQEYGSIGQAPPVYNASNMLFIKIRDLEKVASVIDAATEAGANQIYSLTFSSSEASAGNHRALELAVENARTKAEVLAKASGKTLGELVTIKSEDIYGDYYGARDQFMVKEEAGQGAAIVTGEVVVTAHVTLTYNFE